MQGAIYEITWLYNVIRSISLHPSSRSIPYYHSYMNMNAHHFKPIRPYTKGTDGPGVDQMEVSTQRLFIRRISTACKQCQRRRTKVLIIHRHLSIYIFDAKHCLFNDSALAQIHAWNAKDAVLFVFLTGARTSDGEPT
jgi:hypothetical protein